MVEELHADIALRGDDAKSAREKIEEDGDFSQVAVYLRLKELESIGQVNGNGEAPTNGVSVPPRLPQGVTINMGTMEPEEEAGEADPEFRRRIEELAQREDFQGEAAQGELRELITEALGGNVGQADRQVRRRVD